MLLASALVAQSNPPLTTTQLSLPVYTLNVAPATQANTAIVGNPGPRTIYYWMVTNFTIGPSSPVGPFAVTTAPNTLSGSNYVMVTPIYPAGIASIDLLKTSTSTPPNGGCNCAVATGVTSGTINDQSNSSNSYTISPVNVSSLVVTLTNEVVGTGAAHPILRQNGVFIIDLFNIVPVGGAVTSVELDGTSNQIQITGSTVPCTTVCSWTASLPASLVLPSGTTATTQTAGDASASPATDAFVQTAVATISPTPSYSGNQLISGGGVEWTGALNFTIGAAAYAIQGQQYASPLTNETLAAADPSNPRLDVIGVNNSGAVFVLTGTPAANPAVPTVDPTSQLALTIILVPAGSTTPAVTSANIYQENAQSPTEWNTSSLGAPINLASTNNPYAGSIDIEATAATTGNYAQMTCPSCTVQLQTYNNLIFYLRSKATWPANRSLTVQWFNGATPQGTPVVIRPTGTFGFTSSTTTAYQQIAIPTSLFGLNGISVPTFRVTVTGTGGTIGWYLDDITLQGGQNGNPTGSFLTWRGTWNSTTGYNPNDVAFYNFASWVALVANTASTPSLTNTNWAVMTSAGTNQQVLFNDAGFFNGDAGMLYNKATHALTITGAMSASQYTSTAAGAFTLTGVEGTAPSGVGSSDILWADSSSHCWRMNNNNGGATGCLSTAGSIYTLQIAGSPLTAGDTVNFNATTPAAGAGNINCTFQTSKSGTTDSVSVECPGTGLSDPGTNGLITRTALNTTAPAIAFNVTNLFGSGNCIGFLNGDTSCNPNVFVLNNYSLQAQAFFSRLVTQPTAAMANAYDHLITGLLNSGVWAKLDGLYLYAATDTTTANTNLIQSAFTATPSAGGTITFSANNGYSADAGTTTYLDSNFDPTVGLHNYVRNSASEFAWRSVKTGGSSGRIIGIDGSNTFLLPGTSGRVNTSSGMITSPNWANTGLFEIDRLDATNTFEMVNGIRDPNPGATPASVALTAGKTLVSLNTTKSGATSTTDQLSAYGFGGALTDADSMNLNNYISNYQNEIASALPVDAPLLASDIVNDGNQNDLPGISRLRDGRLIAVYIVQNGSGLQGILKYSLSSDNGHTWGAGITLATPSGTTGYFDGSVTVLANGQIVVSSMLEQNPETGGITPIVFLGTVVGGGAITWSSGISISSALTLPATSSYALLLQNNQLMLPLYQAGGSLGKVTVEFSSDYGNTWGSETTVVDVAVTGNGDQWNESNFVQFPNGTIFGVLRNDSTTAARKGYWTTTSTNNGATWGSLTQIYSSQADPGRPALTMTPAGNLFMVFRYAGPGGVNQTAYTYSLNSGVTWATPTVYFNTSTLSYGIYTYAQCFYDNVSSTFMCAIGQGSFVGASRVNFQQFYPLAIPSPQIVPNGQLPANPSFTTVTAGVAGTTAGYVDLGAGYTTAAMGAQSTATCTNVTNMTWNIAASKRYRMSCMVPMTFAASATVQFCVAGPGTPTSYTINAVGSIGAAGVYDDINLINSTTYGTKTTASGAVGASTQVILVDATIQNGATASGTALTLQTAANGTNNITVLADAECSLTQLN